MDIVDLLLAILHHLLVFSLAGILAAEWVLIRPGLSGPNLQLLARVDGAYGGVAMAVIAIGVCRVIFGLKGWEYYVSNHAFWGKMVAFVVVALLSIRPTMRIIAWRKSRGARGRPSRARRGGRELPGCAPCCRSCGPLLAPSSDRGRRRLPVRSRSRRGHQREGSPPRLNKSK